MDARQQFEAAIERADLSELEACIWRYLEHSATNAVGWNLPVLGSRVEDSVALRTVVLRNVDPTSRTVSCHTDTRSPKFTQIDKTSNVCWLFYDAGHQAQLRIDGHATLHRANEIADSQWESSRLASRRCYLAPQPPGTQFGSPTTNLPEHLSNGIPTEPEVQEGRENFAVITTRIDAMDWLLLGRNGSFRAEYRWFDGRQTADWITP